MKTKLLALALFAGSAMFGQVSVGIQFGRPLPPPRVVRVRPVMPGAGYTWVDGYWYPVGNRYTWHAGYWSRPPYEGATWVAPRYEGGRYFVGYWNGSREPIQHDHRWDKDRRDRDYNRGDHR